MLEENEIVYEILQEKDIEQTINCLVDVFPSAEPMSKALQVTPSELYPFAEMICQKAVAEGLSHVAKDPATSEVAGFIISEHLSNESEEEVHKNIPQKFEVFSQVLKELHEQYEMEKKLVNSKIFHIFLLGAREKYRGRKIGNKLVENNLKMATQAGFSKAIVEASGNISQHICRKYGFEDRVSLDYQTYEYKGVKVFEEIKEHQNCILMEKALIMNNG
ncbi:GNAT family N-acetyltransferase [Dapis sp. BLCC M172]|uniref:GNAT family N-acetyltransferase n=1 Tax=Dapis sp. BLCC M172 TaxID=2975281 RepID=UPI003CEFE7D4